MDSWQQIRLMRHRRRGLAASEDRRLVFLSALEQSEQLARAAAAVGPAARPLPLFYALSQAGRAIAAQHLPDPWRLAGHGLSAPTQAGVPLLRRTIKPAKPARSPDRRPSFSGVAEATGSEALSGAVQVGALWTAIPDLTEPLPQIPHLAETWLRPLRAIPFDEDPTFPIQLPFELLVSGVPDGLAAEAAQAFLGQYPTASEGLVWLPVGFLHDPLTERPVMHRPGPDGKPWTSLKWPNIGRDIHERQRQLDEIAPDYRHLGLRFIVPQLGSAGHLSPLMLWWALLFGLSSIARYDPELWVAALDVNASELAVPVEAALDIALEAIPGLIAEALRERT